MDKAAFEQYCKKIEYFVARLTEIKRITDEDGNPSVPFYSRFLCEICGYPPGLRVEMVAKGKATRTTVFFAVCLDCSYCIEHGKPEPQNLLHRIK